MKTNTMTLRVTTPTKKYTVYWFADYDVFCDDGCRITVTVNTEKNNSQQTEEEFHFYDTDIPIDVFSIPSLERWFYDFFAYKYADIYAENPAVRASILYDLGNYTIETEDEETDGFVKYVYDLTGSQKEYFVRTQCGKFSTDSFLSVKSAEQWVYENLYLDSGIEDTSGNPPFVVFSVQKSTRANRRTAVDMNDENNAVGF